MITFIPFRYEKLYGCSLGEVNQKKMSKRKKGLQRYHTHLHKFCGIKSVDSEDMNAESNKQDEEVRIYVL